MVYLLMIGCGAGPGLGDAEGSLQLDTTDGAKSIHLTHALTFTQNDVRTIALSTWGVGFHCDYADVHIASNPGRDIDRRKNHYDAIWTEGFDELTVLHQKEGLLGSGSSGDAYFLPAILTFDDVEFTGTITSDAGDVSFTAEDCGAL